MKSFLLKVLKNVAISIATLAAFIAIYIVFAVTMVEIRKSTPPFELKQGSILCFDLSEGIADSPTQIDPQNLFWEIVNGQAEVKPNLRAITEAIRAAGDDDRIAGLFIDSNIGRDGYNSSYAALSEVREAIADFKQSGKPTYAYLKNPTPHTYYLASAIDDITINPLGLMPLNGLSANFIYLGDALEKYGIGVQAPRAGRYKSAVEMFTRNSMSEAEREQSTALIQGLWEEAIFRYAETREPTNADLQILATKDGLLNAEESLEAKLTDRVAHWDEMLDVLDAVADVEEPDALTFEQVDIRDYVSLLNFEESSTKPKDDATEDSPSIAIVYAEGEIVDGDGERGEIGGKSLSRKIRMLRKKGEIDALVLRINSPGGSAFAAEEIEREIALISEDIPVVVSMGGYAASGGYWIAARADYIFAMPNTITGSIGVFGLIPNVEKLAANNGVNFDVIKTAPLADITNLSRAKNEREMEAIQTLIDEIYETFLDKVAEGREIQPDMARMIAEGRVWLGRDAVKNNLVDELGGLGDALEKAALLADIQLEQAEIIEVPEAKTLEEIFSEFLSDPDFSTLLRNAALQSRQDPLENYVEQHLPILSLLKNPTGIYARLPFDLHLN